MASPVDIAHPVAARAGVAVTTADAAYEEAVADAGVQRLERGGEVAVGLSGAVLQGRAVAVVGVQPVGPLMHRDAGILAGVAAAAARGEEVDRPAAPVGIAIVVDVDVGGELGLEPGVGRQVGAALLLDLVEVPELLAGRRRVVGDPQLRLAVAGSVGDGDLAKGDVAHTVGAGGARCATACVGDGDVGPEVAGGLRIAVPAVEARGIGGRPERVDGREGPAGDDLRLLDPVDPPRHRPVAAGDLRVAVDVFELDDLAGHRVHPRPPGRVLFAPAERQLPHQQQVVAATEAVAGLRPARRHRQEHERALVDEPVPARDQAGVAFELGECLVAAQEHLRNRRSRRRHLFGAELDEVAVVDPKKDPRTLDPKIAGVDIELDEPQVVGDTARCLSIEAQAVRRRTKQRGDPGQKGAGDALERIDVGPPPAAQK